MIPVSNNFVRCLDELGTRREKISPYLFGLRGINNRFFLPVPRDLPEKGVSLKALTFDFGYVTPALALTPYQESNLNLVVRKNILVWAINATRTLLTTGQNLNVSPAVGGTIPAENPPAFLFNIFHTHTDQQGNANIFQWFNKSIAHLEGGGSARKPALLKYPQLVLSGDQIQVDVTNTQNANLAVQVVLYGGEFD